MPMTTIKYACGHTHKRNLPPHDFAATPDGRAPFVERAPLMQCRSCKRDGISPKAAPYQHDGSPVKATVALAHGATVKAAREAAGFTPLTAAERKRVTAAHKRVADASK